MKFWKSRGRESSSPVRYFHEASGGGGVEAEVLALDETETLAELLAEDEAVLLTLEDAELEADVDIDVDMDVVAEVLTLDEAEELAVLEAELLAVLLADVETEVVVSSSPANMCMNHEPIKFFSQRDQKQVDRRCPSNS